MFMQSWRQVQQVLVGFGVLVATVGVIYPLAMTGFAQVVMPEKANGSLMVVDGQAVGSRIIGVNFENTPYFVGRPSMTSDTPYNAASSGASNYGMSNPALKQAVLERVATWRERVGQADAKVPADLIFASASGLDPHISLQAALFEVPWVAQKTGLSEDVLTKLVHRHAQRELIRWDSEPIVSVLRLNVAVHKALQK